MVWPFQALFQWGVGSDWSGFKKELSRRNGASEYTQPFKEFCFKGHQRNRVVAGRRCESRVFCFGVFFFKVGENMSCLCVIGMTQESGKNGRDSCWEEILSKWEQIDAMHKQRGWSYILLWTDSKYRKAGRWLGAQTEVEDTCDGGSLRKVSSDYFWFPHEMESQAINWEWRWGRRSWTLEERGEGIK